MENYSHMTLVREVELSNIPIPVPAIAQASPSKFTPCMESQLNQSRKRFRRNDAAADQAIQIIHSPFPRLQNMFFPVLNDLPYGTGSKPNESTMPRQPMKYEKT